MPTPNTPREILLVRHASARPALDGQRDALLARFTASAPSRTKARFSALTLFRDSLAVLHRELFAPYRRAWSTLACVWLGILAIHQLDRLAPAPYAPPRVATASADAALLTLWIEHRRQLAALVNEAGSRPSPTPATAGDTLPDPAATRPLGAMPSAAARLAIA